MKGSLNPTTIPKYPRLLQMDDRCDMCGSTTGVAEFSFGTLFGRPMRLCEMCRGHVNQMHRSESLAMEMNFGISETMDPAAGLEKVTAIERELSVKGCNEAEKMALTRLRRLFQARLARKQ